MMDFSMNTAPLTVTQPVTLELIDPTGAVTPIEAELHYDPRDPYAVTTVFMTGASNVRWTFGRDLLVRGPLRAVRRRRRARLAVPRLRRPRRRDHRALLPRRRGARAGPTGDLSIFVERMSKAVEPGTESDHVDVDATIAAIFAAEAA